jgi:hypothetical protein
MTKEIEYIIVSYEQYTDYEFIEPGSFFVMSATQDYYFFKTSDRAKAQAKCDELFGKGKYTVKTSKNQKTKSKQEGGGLSATGSTTRKGSRAWLRPTV